MTGCVTELVPGRIFAVGGSIAADRCRAWYPAETRGHVPFTCYVLRDGPRLFLVDAGLPALRTKILSGLDEVIAGSADRYFMMTRRELDVIAMLPEIVRRYGFRSVHCGGEMNALDFFDKLDNANADAHGRSFLQVPFVFQREGPIETSGGLALEMFKAPLMVLPTYWFYEATSRTLLGSDFWGFLADDGPRRQGFICTDPDRISSEAIRRFLDVKFDWLVGIDTRPLIGDLRRVFEQRTVDRICPSYGCMFEGRSVVAKLFEETIGALTAMARQPQRNLLAGWTYAGAA